LGIAWDEKAEGVVVREIRRGSPGAAAGLRVGDQIVAAEDREVHSGDEFRAIVLGAESPLRITVRRPGAESPVSLNAPLGGSPTRFGIVWRTDDAEPDAVIVSRLTPGAPAALAGVRLGERIYRLDGQSVTGSDECGRLFNAATGPVDVALESQGRIRVVRLAPLERIPRATEPAEAAANPAPAGSP